MRKLILLPTIQATGTWFCIHLIQKHSSFEYFSVMSEVDEAKLAAMQSTALVQVHVGLESFGLDKEKDSKFLPLDQIMAWAARADKVLIPLRDPLLCLITGRSRLHDLFAIVNGFVYASQWADKNVFFAPIDLYGNERRALRLAFLESMFNYLGLKKEPYLKTWSRWPVINTLATYGIKSSRSYGNGDLAGACGQLSEVYDYLQSKKAIIRPFLESVGYRNLIWW